MRTKRKQEKLAYQSPQIAIISLNSLCKIEASMCYNDGRAWDYLRESTCSCGGDEACGNIAGCKCNSVAMRIWYKKVSQSAREFLQGVATALSIINNDEEWIEKMLECFDNDAQVIEVTTDTIVYRYYGGESNPFGPWVTTENYTLEEAMNSLALPLDNACTAKATYLLSAGASALYGTASDVFGDGRGGGPQLYLEDVNNLTNYY